MHAEVDYGVETCEEGDLGPDDAPLEKVMLVELEKKLIFHIFCV